MYYRIYKTSSDTYTAYGPGGVTTFRGALASDIAAAESDLKSFLELSGDALAEELANYANYMES